MGRPRNEEEVERLQDAAFELFAVKGLDATSYSDIAKSHVQHYFPKKEMLVARFVDRSMEAVLKIARELPEFEAMDPLSKLVYVDYIQFYYAMFNEKMFRTVEDISRRGFAAKDTKSCRPTKCAAAACIAAISKGRCWKAQYGPSCGGRMSPLYRKYLYSLPFASFLASKSFRA